MENEINCLSEAKCIFDKYNGDPFHMSRGGEYDTYKKYNVSSCQESIWWRDKTLLLKSKLAIANDKVDVISILHGLADIVVAAQNVELLFFMIAYLEDNFAEFDTLTNLLIIKTIARANAGLSGSVKKTNALKAISFLKNLISAPITVSDDFKKDKYFCNMPFDEKGILRSIAVNISEIERQCN